MWDLGLLQLSAMLVGTFLLLASAVLRAQFLLYQIPPFQFVDVGGSAEIACISSENIEHITYFFSWYKRRGDETMRLVKKSCLAEKSKDKFACKAEGKKVMLKISNLQVADSGLYLCAERWSLTTGLTFGNGSSLVVGDSYTPSSWVMLLQPAASPAPQSEKSDHLACVVHGVSGRVQLSWDVPGGLRQEGRTLLVKNSTGSLAFLSLLRVPPGASRASGEPYACEVRFNSSGISIKRTMALPAASSEDPDAERSCPSHTLLWAALSTLLALLLSLLLTLLGIRLCRSRLAHGLRQPRDPDPPGSEEPQQEDLAYARLDIGLKIRERSHQRQAFLNTEKPT